MLRHTLRVVAAIALVFYFIVATLLLGLRYVVLPHIDAWRPRIEALVSEKLHADFRIGRLAPHWSGFQPGLDITDLTIRDHHGVLALNVPHATASVSWRSLVERSVLLSSIVVEQPDVLIERDADGMLSVAGVQVPSAHTGNATFTTWLMRQQAIVLRGGTLRWRDATHDVPELALPDIRLAILNDGYDHHFALQAPNEGTLLRGPLDFRAHFQHARSGQPGKPADWSGDVYLSTGPVDLPTLARYVDLPIATYAGRINNAIWAHFAAGRVLSASGVLDGTDVALRVRPTQPQLNLPTASFSWQLGASAGDYHLQLGHFRAELGQPPLDDGTPVIRTLVFSTLDARFREQSVQHGQLFSVRGDRIDLGILSEFMRALPLPSRAQNALVRFDPRGLVANYELGLERAKPDAGEAAAERHTPGSEPIIHYRFKGDLQGISVAAQEPPPGLTARNHPRAGLPGFENLWGHIDADERAGTIQFDTANAAVTLPGVLDNPRLTLDRLYGAGDWTVAAERAPGDTHKAFRINVSEFGVANPDVRAKMTAVYTNAGHGRGSLDLTANFEKAQVKAIPRYLPTSLNEKFRTFLGHGLQAGTSKGATIEIHGNLDKFPYIRDPDAGQFRIVAPFNGGRFDPSPYPPRKLKNGEPSIWPAFDGIDGVFRLAENKLRFDIARSHYRNFVLHNVSGRIDDLGTRSSNFVIAGTGRGPLADLLDYANHSTLGAMSKHVGEKVQARGSATLALELTIPRVPKPKIRTAGTIGFENDDIAAENAPPLSNVTGRLRFTNHSATAERLAGRFLGGDVHVDGGLHEDGHYALDVSGHMAVDAARGLDLHGPVAAVLARMSGRAPYALSVRGARGQLPDVTADSDLTDLALDLPAPFGKAAGTPMPLRFVFQPGAGAEAGAPDLQHADLTFGPLAASYELRHVPGQPPEVVRGAIGVNRPADLPAQGVTAAVDLPAFDADAWRSVGQQLRAAAGAAGRSPAAQPKTAPVEAEVGSPAQPAATANVAGEIAHTTPAENTANGADGTDAARLADATPAASDAGPAAAPPPADHASSNMPTAAGAAAAASAAPSLPGSGALAQYLPSRFAVHIGSMTLLKRHWEDVVVGASRSGNQWQANVASSQVSGHLSWQPGAAPGAPGTLQARLAKLILPATAENDLIGQAISTPAQNMPAIDLVVNQLIVRGHDFGRLQVDAHNFDESGVPVWQLDRLDLTNPAAHLSATANWRTAGDPDPGDGAQTTRRTALDFRLDIKDAGALLERAGMPRTIKGGEGVLSGKVGWRGGPTAIDYPTLDGSVAVELHHGQILKVDPGVAKLLGVLSLQSLARVATLNFRDVLGEGLPFTNIAGTGQISNGIGRTSDFTMVTAPARAEMNGTVDLARETQDLRVHIVPTVSAGAGVVAAAVINPFLGLGALIADFALSHSIETAFAFNYSITGSWAKPHVERLHGDQGKMDEPAPLAAAR